MFDKEMRFAKTKKKVKVFKFANISLAGGRGSINTGDMSGNCHIYWGTPAEIRYWDDIISYNNI